MESELKQNLLSLAEAYALCGAASLSTLGRRAAGDWRFFDRLKDNEKSFTARKYDEVVKWFSDNWPENADWPANVSRPPQVPT